MICEYKLVPLNRQTGRPAFLPDEVKPQLTVDLNLLYQTMETVNPIQSAGILPALIITPQMDIQIIRSTVAEALSEMFGADVWYRRVGSGEEWKLQPSRWQPKRRK